VVSYVVSELKERETREFRFHRLDKPEEFRAAEEVQRVAWGLEDEPPVPAPIMRAIQDNGGLVLGAFADIYLAGFALGFLGWDGKQLFHYSHMTGVRPEYQNHHVGFRLKAFQREAVLKQGLAQIRWTFDPLQSRNARLNLRRLGARPDRYYVDYYGQMGSNINRDLESDRLRVIWELSDPDVAARLEGKLPSTADDLARYQRSIPILETESGPTGLRTPTAVSEPSDPLTTIEIPFDLASVREHEPDSLRRWRHAARDSFRAAFDLGYRVDDFVVLPIEHERRSFYLLRAPITATSPSAAPA
jgi:predicted GNAT superfamily acetyltransferase